MASSSASTETLLEENIAKLASLGFADVEKNREVLEKFNNRLKLAANFLMDHEDDSNTTFRPRPNLHGLLPSLGVGGVINKTKSTPGAGAAAAVTSKGYDLRSICKQTMPYSKKPKIEKKPILLVPDAKMEECPICCNEYDTSASHWKELTCSHKLCLTCYQTIESSGTTMSGVLHTSVRCPFCQSVSGSQVGDCPDGTMTVSDIPSSCEGYPDCGTIQVTYSVSSGQYHLYRTGYLPDNEEGKRVVELLRVAWDRRLCFVIGNSLTTGRENVLVWNIHHKTSLGGGVKRHGYPDPEYIQRLLAELKDYGIE